MKKIFRLLLTAALVAWVLTACDKDDMTALTLSADRETIAADGKDVVTFTVIYEGETVDAAVIISGTTTVADNCFFTRKAGEYRFTATYNGMMSNEVTITATFAHLLDLIPDKTEIYADGTDEVNFTVEFDGEDVTANAMVCMVDAVCLTTPLFATETVGKYHFYATYEFEGEAYKSNEVAITANPLDMTKNVAFFTWTATWCEPCYMQKGYMKNLVDDYGDHVVQVNFHTSIVYDAIGVPPSVAQTEYELFFEGRFEVDGYPSTVVELDEQLVPGHVPSEALLRKTYDKYIVNSPKAGIEVTSSISGDKVNATITVSARERAGQYSVGVILVEDHIAAAQSGYGEGYDHTNVARQMGTPLFGVDIGTVEAGQSAEKTFSMDVLPEYNPENLSIVVYTLYYGVYIDNAIKVPVNGHGGYE